ncbi:MAG: hypothetical protein KDA89_13325, partial [Planctomycetaceae bacterium]|nr:hypothetical protein [Planctomycetaceae bacterium]
MTDCVTREVQGRHETVDEQPSVSGRHNRLMVLLFCVHTVMLSWCAMRNSFCWTEAGLLPSGIIDWQFGDFAAFRVNPPLIRMWATLPVLVLDPDVPYYGESENPRHRFEWDLARTMIETNGTVAWTWLFWARLMCLPFSLLGMYVAGLWAREQLGNAAQVGTVFLWTFSPWMIGYGSLMSGDAQAASMGVVVLYAFRCWLRDVSFSRSYILGVAAGITVLTKLSWLILFGMLPLLWIVVRAAEWFMARYTSDRIHSVSRWPLVREVWAALFSVVTCLLVVNLAYGFKGSCRLLGDYRFISKALAGSDDWQMDYFDGNRFRDTWLGRIPVPLPEDLVIGLDLQKWDFDRERWSYFGGEWRNHGWWFYYLFGLCVKTPIGSLLLFLLAVSGTFTHRRWRTSCCDTLVLLFPVCLILTLASAETGLNRHTRYVLPVVPLLILFTGRVFQILDRGPLWGRRLVILCCAWQMLSSLWMYPHSHSYFNELTGGPLNAHRFMNASNLDWGQDLKFVKEWCERHPDRR